MARDRGAPHRTWFALYLCGCYNRIVLTLGTIAIRAVLFDLDGTLVHTDIDFARMRTEIRRMALQAGVAAELIEGKQVLEVVDAAVQAVGPRGTKLRASMWGMLERIERDGCSNPSPIKGAEQMLQMLKSAGVPTAVVTRNCRAVSVPLLERFNLRPDALLARDDVRKTKPDPEHLSAALRELGVAPGHACMVGDHWLDIRAAFDSGCAASIGVIGDRDTSSMAQCPPTYTVRDLVEAAALFS